MELSIEIMNVCMGAGETINTTLAMASMAIVIGSIAVEATDSFDEAEEWTYQFIESYFRNLRGGVH